MNEQKLDEQDYSGFFILFPKHETQGYDHWLSNAKDELEKCGDFPTLEEAKAFCKENDINPEYIYPSRWIRDMT